MKSANAIAKPRMPPPEYVHWDRDLPSFLAPLLIACGPWFHDRMRRTAFVLALSVLAFAAPAFATPGPDSVVVVANSNVPESVTLAQRYAEARDVPANQVCLLDVPDMEDVDLDVFTMQVLQPLQACLDAGGVRDRIEAALLIRGLPLRVGIPVGGSTQKVSLAAALGVWDSTSSDGTTLLGQDPGAMLMCGSSSCYGAAWSNPYQSGPFEPGWSADQSGVHWQPLLVTMLHARTYDDAGRLLDSALMAESDGPATGEFLFMEGADSARGYLDFENAAVISGLTDRGLSASSVPFDANLTGQTLAAFFTGTAHMGETIEGNTYLPGSLVDNLTSFGAAPANFRDSGESQVSIARWVAMGVAGVHGTVAEPLNNCFPHRRLILDYVDGATLAEAYGAAMPYAYWRNLVLGDPMAAPYAMRPMVQITGASDGDRLSGAVSIHVDATDPGDRGIASIVLYADGVEVARADERHARLLPRARRRRRPSAPGRGARGRGPDRHTALATQGLARALARQRRRIDRVRAADAGRGSERTGRRRRALGCVGDGGRRHGPAARGRLRMPRGSRSREPRLARAGAPGPDSASSSPVVPARSSAR